MPTVNARGHAIPTSLDTSVTRETIFESFGNSIRDVVPVANEAARSTLVSNLTTAGQGPTSTRPLVVYRHNARGLHRLEYTIDGTVWIPASGVLTFADLAAATSWATSNSAYLTVGDVCMIGAVQYRWNGAAWIAQLGGLHLIKTQSFAAASATNLDGVFSSLYDNYLIKLNIASASSDAGATLQLRAAGAALGSGYAYAFLEFAVGIGPTRQELGSSPNWAIGRYAAGGGSQEVELFSPALAQAKRIIMRSTDQTSYQRQGGGYNNSTAVHDGVGIQFPTTATGVVKLYGYANG